MENVTVNLSFKKELLAQIDWLAKKESRSRSELIREAARIYIAENQEEHMIHNYFDINPERLNATRFEVAEKVAEKVLEYKGMENAGNVGYIGNEGYERNRGNEKTEKKYTYADYMTWPNDERWELIDGISYNMTPAPSSGHQSICTALVSEFYQYLKGKPCKVFTAPFDVRLYDAKDALADGTVPDNKISNVVQPDVTVICSRNKIDVRGCLGSPDLAVEVISKYTSRKDSINKLNTYEKFGVREFWMVRPEEKTIMVFRLDSKNGLGNADSTDGPGRYGRPKVYGEGDIMEVDLFPDFRLNLSEIFQIL